MTKTILVTGATGHQGRAVIDALLSADSSEGFTILALTRNASSPSANALLAKAPRSNLRLVQGNLDDVPAVFAAAKAALPGGDGSKQIWGVFSVQVSLGPGVTTEGEVAQGCALIDAAIENGVQHFVYSSVDRGGDKASWENATDVPHFRSKYRIEQHLKEVTAEGKAGAGMAWTVLRPVVFMDNLEPGFTTKVFVAALRNYLGEREKTLQWVAVADIGVFAAKVFAEPEKWDRKAVGLAGDELTMEQLNRAFEKALGEPVPATYGFFGSALTGLMREMGAMLEWFASQGYGVNIEELRKEYPGLLTMEEWLAKKSRFTGSQ
jgi:uncharacterized protein YbjT (DUF2867 family)